MCLAIAVVRCDIEAPTTAPPLAPHSCVIGLSPSSPVRVDYRWSVEKNRGRAAIDCSLTAAGQLGG
jgi:hypothetical protein